MTVAGFVRPARRPQCVLLVERERCSRFSRLGHGKRRPSGLGRRGMSPYG